MKHHFSYFYNALFEYYLLHQTEWQTRWSGSLVAKCLALWSVIQQCVYETQSSWHWWAATASYCMFGTAWSSRWVMTQLTNGKRTCICKYASSSCYWRIFWTYFVTIICFLCTLRGELYYSFISHHAKIIKIDQDFPLWSQFTPCLMQG